MTRLAVELERQLVCWTEGQGQHSWRLSRTGNWYAGLRGCKAWLVVALTRELVRG
jgi:hypothetical protein